MLAHDSDNGNWVVGIKEEKNGNLLLDKLELYEGRGFRKQFNSYNNLLKLKRKELSKCKTFLEN